MSVSTASNSNIYKIISDAAGLVGIGTTSPGSLGKLVVVGGNIVANGGGTVDPEFRLSGASGSVTRNWAMGTDVTQKLYWYDWTALAYRMVITSAGLVGIGTTSPGSTLSVVGSEWPARFQFSDATITGRAGLLIQRSLGTTASPGAVTAGTNIGGLSMGGHDGTSYSSGYNGGVEIHAFANETWTNSARGAYLRFETTPDGTTAPVERVRITAAGKVLVNLVTDYGPNMYISGGQADSTTSYGFVVNTPKPALTAGSYSNMAYFANNRSSMNDGLRIVNYRFSTGSSIGDWQTEDFRIMRDVDQNGFTGSAQCSIVWGASTLSLMTANTSRLYIKSDGNVGIGTTIPGHTLHTYYASGSSYIMTDAGGSNDAGIKFGSATVQKWVIYNNPANSHNIYVLNASNTNGVYMTQSSTAWAANSDSRLKDVKETIANALDKVNQLNGVRFSWKRDANNPDAHSYVGLIAQDVLAVLPEAVDNEQPDLITDEETGKVSGGLGVRYTELVPLLVNAIKELTTRIATLEQRA